MDIEIIDFPINSMVIFHSYVSLPLTGTRFYHNGTTTGTFSPASAVTGPIHSEVVP